MLGGNHNGPGDQSRELDERAGNIGQLCLDGGVLVLVEAEKAEAGWSRAEVSKNGGRLQDGKIGEAKEYKEDRPERVGRVQKQIENHRPPRWALKWLHGNGDAIREESGNAWYKEHKERGNEPGGLGGGAPAKLGGEKEGGGVAGDGEQGLGHRKAGQGQTGDHPVPGTRFPTLWRGHHSLLNCRLLTDFTT